METNERKLIRRPEAAKLLGNMPISTLEKNKEIPVVRIGASVYYDTDDLWAWIERKKDIGFGFQLKSFGAILRSPSWSEPIVTWPTGPAAPRLSFG